MPLALHRLTGKELGDAHKAVDHLLTLSNSGKAGSLDRSLYVKLETLRADMSAEQEERKAIAAGRQSVQDGRHQA